jgi:hypothetical protein
VTLAEFVADPCMCQGDPIRLAVNGLSLLVCVECRKATAPRAARRGDAQTTAEANA